MVVAAAVVALDGVLVAPVDALVRFPGDGGLEHNAGDVIDLGLDDVAEGLPVETGFDVLVDGSRGRRALNYSDGSRRLAVVGGRGGLGRLTVLNLNLDLGLGWELLLKKCFG